jgi:hypothetical protein
MAGICWRKQIFFLAESIKMRQQTAMRYKPAFSILGLLATFAVPAVRGASYIWDGSTSGSWGVGSNWNIAPVSPLSDDILTFPDSGANRVMTQTFPGTVVINRLNFSAPGYSVTGNGFSLGSSLGSPVIALSHTSGTTTINTNLTLQQAASLQIATGATLNFTGNGGSGGTINLDLFALTVLADGRVGFSTVITGGGRLNLNGSGVVRMEDGFVQTYSGQTALNSGTLIVNESLVGLNLTCANGAVLGGFGVVNPLQTIINGTLAPGDNGVGRITVLRALTFGSTGRMSFELGRDTTAGVTYDQLRCQNTLELAGSLVLAILPDFAPTANTVYTLINKTSDGPSTGFFVGWPEGAVANVGGFPMRISYLGGDGNDVTLSYATNPPPVVSAFSATAAAGGGQRIQMSVKGGPAAASRTVFLQTSSDLLSWANLTSAPADAAGQVSFDVVDTNTAPPGRRYYRARIP